MEMRSAATSATADVLRALAEPVRWRIVELLADEELCVCHLVQELDLAQPLVSHHLRVLRVAGLVETERWRYWTYYRLRPDRICTLAEDVAALASASDAALVSGSNRRPCC